MTALPRIQRNEEKEKEMPVHYGCVGGRVYNVEYKDPYENEEGRKCPKCRQVRPKSEFKKSSRWCASCRGEQQAPAPDPAAQAMLSAARGWRKVPDQWVWTESQVKVWRAAIDRLGQEGGLVATTTTYSLAQRAGVGTDTVRKALRRLDAAGLIDAEWRTRSIVLRARVGAAAPVEGRAATAVR